MGEEKKERGKLIKAAGGLLWQETPNGLKIAVIQRFRYGNDWSLPKGKLKLGEQWQEAALRDVVEGQVAGHRGGAIRVSNGQRSPHSPLTHRPHRWEGGLSCLNRAKVPLLD